MTPKALAEDEGKPIALEWIDVAILALRDHLEWLVGGDEPRSKELVVSALAINFSLTPAAASRLATLVHVWRILGTFTRAREVIVHSERWFFDVSAEEARGVFSAGTPLPPAYAMFERGVYFTPAFAPHDVTTRAGFGPRCRAAMIVHESVHVVDALSGLPNIHISEWQEPAFGAQTIEESVHNPSSYASFSAQVYEEAIAWPPAARYGAGRPGD